MLARSRPSSLPWRHAAFSAQQRRLLNHFISEVPKDAIPSPPSPTRFTLAVKDNIATADGHTTTTCGSPFLSNYRSPFEATIVSQLRARGGRVVGKTNLDEFGMGSHSVHSAFGAVAQDSPEQLAGDVKALRSAGGSSGGSAVSVLLGEADVALGTDTGGSVRLPAAYCGVVGFKPSYGMLSRFGVVPYANSLDTVGFLAREVRPIRELIVGDGTTQGLWAEHDPNDPTSLTPSARKRCARSRQFYSPSQSPDPSILNGLRLGLPLEYNIHELSPTIRDAWSRAASLLQSHFSARIIPVSLPSTRHALSAYYVIAPAEASSNLAKYDGIRYGVRDTSVENDAAADGVLYASSRGKGFGPEVRRRILLGAYTLSSKAMDNYFLQAQRVRRLVRRDFDRVFALPNPLVDPDQQVFDLSDLPEGTIMEDKWGPEEVDFLLCPTAPTLAPTLGEVMEGGSPVDEYVNDVFTVPASLAGLPAASVPMPVEGEGEGKTAGLQLIGQYWDDARLLAVAEVIREILRG